jgi:SulP family sulfate permease
MSFNFLQPKILNSALGLGIGSLIGSFRTIFSAAALSVLLIPQGLVDKGHLLLFLLIGGALAGLIITKFSSYKNVIVQPQDGPAILVSVYIASIIPTILDSSLKLPIIYAFIVVNCITTGIVFYFLGFWKLGRYVRFIPYPVIGGFLCGSGILLALSSCSILLSKRLQNLDPFTIFQDPHLFILLIGILIGILLFYSGLKSKSKLYFPLILVVSTVLIHLWFYFHAVSIEELQNTGWLINANFEPGADLYFSWLDAPKSVWILIAKNFDSFLAIAVISVVGILLNLSGLEVAAHSEFDFNKELKIAGIANIMCGFLGGAVSYHGLSLSTIGEQMRVSTRWIGYLTYLITLSILIIGPGILGYVPKPVLGGVLLSSGLALGYQWLVKGLKHFSRPDYLTICTITLVISFVSYAAGVLVGLFLCTLIFVWNYSHVKIITHERNGRDFRSNVERTKYLYSILDQQANKIRLLKIEGFLFFGTVYSIYDRIQHLVKSGVEYLILDMSMVKDLDLSSVTVFGRIAKFCNQANCQLIYSRTSKEITDLLRNQYAENVNFHIFSDRDHAIEYCENIIIEKYGSSVPEKYSNIWDRVGFNLSSADSFERLSSFFIRRHYEANVFVFHQNEISDEMFIIESGRIDIIIEPNEQIQNSIRLRSMTTGAFIGEAALFEHGHRSASAITLTPVEVLVITTEKFKEMDSKYPELSALIFRTLSKTLLERLSNTNKLVAKLDP